MAPGRAVLFSTWALTPYSTEVAGAKTGGRRIRMCQDMSLQLSYRNRLVQTRDLYTQTPKRAIHHPKDFARQGRIALDIFVDGSRIDAQTIS